MKFAKDRGQAADPQPDRVPPPFTRGELLILRMLADLFKKMEVDSEINPDLVADSIDHEHSWALPIVYPGICGSQHPQPEVVREVFQIMSMWLAFEDGIEKLKPDQKQALERQAEEDDCSLGFLGFDKNHESEHCSVATYVARTWKDYARYAGRDLNAHCPMIEKHRAMLVEYETTRGPLKFKDLQAMLRAQIGPVFH